MNKKFFALAVLVGAIFFSSTSVVYAVQTTGVITNYNATRWEVFLFAVSGKVNPIACDTNGGYAIPTNTPWGKVAIAAVIAAKTAGSTVTVEGMGTCNYYKGNEDIMFISIIN